MARVSKVTKAPAPLASAEKASHPADVRRDAVLADPAGYTASIRANGRNNTLPAPTLAHAAIAAAGLEEASRVAFGASTRATVYALPRDGGGAEVVAPAVWRALVTDAQRAAMAAGARRNLKG